MTPCILGSSSMLNGCCTATWSKVTAAFHVKSEGVGSSLQPFAASERRALFRKPGLAKSQPQL